MAKKTYKTKPHKPKLKRKMAERALLVEHMNKNRRK